MAIKTELKLKLFAGNVEVAESDSVDLWQNVFAAINRGDGQLTNIDSRGSYAEDMDNGTGQDKAIENFAEALKITTDELQGACVPSKQEPHIHLDEQYWEALKDNTPKRGPGAVSSVVLSATLLALWFKYAGLGLPLLAQACEVEQTINLQDKARTRSLKNCSWLQIRGGKIAINPAEISRAIELASAYCTKHPLKKEN